jgi:hypothetical protein
MTEDGSCLVGVSKWESSEVFRASGITLRASEEVIEVRPVRGSDSFYTRRREPAQPAPV